MAALGECESEVLLGLTPVAGVQMPLPFHSIEMAFAMPFFYVRLSPAGHTHGDAEKSRDADHMPTIGNRWEAT